MKGQLNTLNLRNNKDSIAPDQIWQEENNRFYQEERIRRARNEADVKAMQEEIISNEKKETGRGVGKVTFFWMLTIAVMGDFLLFLVGLIPVIGWLINATISLCLWLTFFMWFKNSGIKFDSPRKILAMFGPGIEIIPYINIIPTWTLLVVVNTQSDKVASKVGLK